MKYRILKHTESCFTVDISINDEWVTANAMGSIRDKRARAPILFATLELAKEYLYTYRGKPAEIVESGDL